MHIFSKFFHFLDKKKFLLNYENVDFNFFFFLHKLSER